MARVERIVHAGIVALRDAARAIEIHFCRTAADCCARACASNGLRLVPDHAHSVLPGALVSAERACCDPPRKPAAGGSSHVGIRFLPRVEAGIGVLKAGVSQYT